MYDLGAPDADDGARPLRENRVMRDIAAAGALLVLLAIAALLPNVWPDDAGSRALATGRPPLTGPLATVATVTFSPAPSWRGKDGGTGYVVCAASDTWTRPGLVEQNAHLAADPRYVHMHADDSFSDAWRPFHAAASAYDGSSLAQRIDLVALMGLWSDPRIGGNAVGCTSSEPQVWLVGYAPVTYVADDRDYGFLRVVPAPGYRMVILTGVIRPELVVVAATKLGVFAMPPNAITPTPKPAPKATLTPPSPESPFPMTDRPLELALPGCEISPQGRHADGLGAVWTVQCGSARANLAVSVAAVKQGWGHLAGPPIGVGMQNYAKGKLSMQLAYRLDGPEYSDPIVLVQYSRPFAQGAGAASPPSPMAYLRVTTGFELPPGCLWKEAPVGFTNDGAYEVGFACAGLPAPEIRGAFHRALLAQGWRSENGGFGFINYAKDDLRLTANFVNEKAEPAEIPWVVESLCCFGP